LDKVRGDTTAKKEIMAAMEAAEIDSPRGKWTMSKAHNPIQDIYLRQVVGGKEAVLGVAKKALADPASVCTASGRPGFWRPVDLSSFAVQILNSVQYGFLLFLLSAGL